VELLSGIGDAEAPVDPGSSIVPRASTYNRIVVDTSAAPAECALAIEALARRAPVVVVVNNHSADYAPATAPELHPLLGLLKPVPPLRPRTTLLD
jgi:hypothetical protein